MVHSIQLPHYDLPRASRAIAKLLRDPDDLPQVFTVIDSLSGMTPHRLMRGFRRRPEGVELLRARPDIVSRLADREALRALPAGSLGRAYLAFVEREGISAEGLREASLEGAPREGVDDACFYVSTRMRDTHDLWHAATGYQGDVAGELGLLAFTLAQTRHAGIAFILAVAFVKGLGGLSTDIIPDGFRRGRAAKWLPTQDWESLLPRPLDEVRALLNLGNPPIYVPMRSSDLRAQGVI